MKMSLNRRFKLVTAFSTDYDVGHLCSKVNQEYCQLRGYEWAEAVLSKEQMLKSVSPRNHCTWYKVHIIIDELARALDDIEDTIQIDNNGVNPLPVLNGDTCVGEKLNEDDYLVWVDADAVFVDHEATLEKVVLEGKEREVIIGEDMHVGNLINCGIIVIKVSHWSLQLWRQVFQCRRYDTVTFYEQSALHKVFKTRREFAPFFNAATGEDRNRKRMVNTDHGKSAEPHLERPWHSFCIRSRTDDTSLDKNANADCLRDSVKVFEHTAVFPMHLLNSNICDWDLEEGGLGIRQHRKGKERGWVHQRARLVYHAAGYSKKMSVISEMIKLRLPHIDLENRNVTK